MTICQPGLYLNGVVDFLLVAHKSDAKFNQLIEAEASDLDKNQNEKAYSIKTGLIDFDISTKWQYNFGHLIHADDSCRGEVVTVSAHFIVDNSFLDEDQHKAKTL